MDNHHRRNSRYLYSVHQVKSSFDQPILTSFLDNRPMGLAILGAAVLHTVLVILGLPSWSCPIREYLGFPCPGCGLSRSITALFEGEWKTSLTIHAFGPVFLIALGILGIVNMVPLNQRKRIITQIRQIEQLTNFTAVILSILILYWAIRLLFFRETLFGLVMS